MVVRLRGEFGYEQKEPLREFFTSLIDDYKAVTIDLSTTTFLDSSFLGNLIVANKLARERGIQLRLKLGAPDSNVSRIFALAELHTVFALDDGHDDA